MSMEKQAQRNLESTERPADEGLGIAEEVTVSQERDLPRAKSVSELQQS